jgi:hypothetical protein
MVSSAVPSLPTTPTVSAGACATLGEVWSVYLSKCVCEDISAYCWQWMKEGHCEPNSSNSFFMTNKCAATCRRCTTKVLAPAATGGCDGAAVGVGVILGVLLLGCYTSG